MYEQTFHLSERPFVAAPLADRYFPAAAFEQTLATLARGIERAAGPGLVIGPPGTGKSLVCHLLAEHFRDHYLVALLTGARLASRRALLQNILYELGLPYRGLEEGELRLALIDHLDPRDDCPNGMLLLVDEAHALPTRLLDEIRMITNLVRDGLPRVRLVLAGGLELEERFASPRLQSFQQRIAARCYLKPLTRDETFGYVRWQISEAGGNPDALFTEDALAQIHNSTGGIPRLVNQLCDHALIMAAAGGTAPIEAAGAAEAWADLQQLPAPLFGSSPAAESNVIEFGPLPGEHAAAARPQTPNESSAPSGTVEFGNDPTAALDEIEELLDQSQRYVIAPGIEADEEFAGAAEFRPLISRPEVELVFHEAHSPFGQHFEEEEVVIDRYASLESTGSARTRVTSPEGREIAACLPNGPEPPHAEPRADAGFSHELPQETAHNDGPLDPASDPVMPEAGVRIAAESWGAARVATMVAAHRVEEEPPNLRLTPHDDRDAIVVEDAIDPVETDGIHPLGAVKRREYRQLFAKLRRG